MTIIAGAQQRAMLLIIACRRSHTLSSVRHLSKAPVKEALINCQFSGNWARDMAEICSELAGDLGRVSDLFETSFQLTVNNEGGQTTFDPSANSRVGKRIDFEVTRQVLQIQRDSFTFSQLEPYGSWDQVAENAKRLWDTLSGSLTELKVSRLAVRYINVIQLPLPFSDFDDYFKAAPQIPAHLPQGLSQFLLRTASPVDDDLVVVTQSLDAITSDAESASVVLDIEVSCENPEELKINNIENTLDRLRERKNAVFFSYVTEKTLEMYE